MEKEQAEGIKRQLWWMSLALWLIFFELAFANSTITALLQATLTELKK